MLERWPGCALVVSHDRFFLARVATSILAMEGDGRATLYAGNWSSYHERKVEARAAVDAAAKMARVRPSVPPVDAAAPKKLTYAERIELDGILDVIAAAEVRAAELEAKLSDPGIWSRPQEEGKRLRSDLDLATSEVARLVARWEELEKRRG
jgi:ATP-binding cassette subfamily F protein uup